MVQIVAIGTAAGDSEADRRHRGRPGSSVFAALWGSSQPAHADARPGDWELRCRRQWLSFAAAGRESLPWAETGLDRYREHTPFDIQRRRGSTGISTLAHDRNMASPL